MPVIYDAADTFLNFDKHLDKSKIMICCSFHPTKSLPANESGLIICPKKNLKHLKSIISFGYTGINREANLLGFNGKFSEYDAAIFNANYDKKNDIKNKIKKNLIYFKKEFNKLNKKNIFLQNELGEKWISSKLSFYSTKKITVLKNEFRKFNIDIYSAWNQKPMHMHNYFKKYRSGNLSYTKKLYNKFFTIPFNFTLKKIEIDRIIKAIQIIF